MFRARVGDRELEGLDLIRFDDTGRIRDFTVMVRPRSAIEALLAQVAPRLAAAFHLGRRAVSASVQGREPRIVSAEDVYRRLRGRFAGLGQEVFAVLALDARNVVLEENASVWFSVVIRGDAERIHIGAGSNIQDGAVCHADPGQPLLIGRNVTVGHNAMVHGCTIGDHCLVGINATMTSGAVDASTFDSMTAAAVDQKVDLVRDAAGDAGRSDEIEMNIRAFMVFITDDGSQIEAVPAPPPFKTDGSKQMPDSIFGSDLITEKSLDEVILAYLSEDMDD